MDTKIKIVLILLLLYVGITAVWGGGGLLLKGGSAFALPADLLENTPFPDYTIPGLILTFIVGGTNLLAAYLLFKKHKFALEATATAGFGLAIWLFTELYLLPDSHFIQTVYFAIAVVTLVLTMILVKRNVGK